jgi:EAL domain-containing protein (putative c-di-GMP-specific phosphodiesterase class I)
MTEIHTNSISDDGILNALGLRDLTIHFQPIVSMKSKAVAGYEGLMRGLGPLGETVPPVEVLNRARRANLTIETDRLCRAAVMRSFSGIRPDQRHGKLLFLNFESSLLNIVDAGNGYLFTQVEEAGLTPSDIVIELIESKVNNPISLMKFVEFYRMREFLIALDDVGSGYSNFDRIPQIKPDIIKVDRSIIQGIENDYYRQEVFRSLKNLSRKIGTLVLAEGVETGEESLEVMDLDADLIQGYYFSRPKPFSESLDNVPEERATRLRKILRERKVREVTESRQEHAAYDEMVVLVWTTLRKNTPDQFNTTLRDLIDNFPEMEAAYVLNMKGIQVSNTVLNGRLCCRPHPIFHGAIPGDDLSLKEYYYLLVDTGMKKFTTDTYVSLATGNRIRTISTVFGAGDGHTYVLCVDVSREEGVRSVPL